MKEILTKDIRNISLVAHGDSGKTSLAEAILYSAGEINRLGTIDDGTTTSDHQVDEIDRKISISATLLHCLWNNTKINIIDAPGYADFISEAICALRVADLAVVLVDSVAGVEVGTVNVMDIIHKDNI